MQQQTVNEESSRHRATEGDEQNSRAVQSKRSRSRLRVVRKPYHRSKLVGDLRLLLKCGITMMLDHIFRVSGIFKISVDLLKFHQ